MYEFKVDLNGDAIEEVTYRFTFNERDQQGKQSYTVRRIRGAEAVDPHAAGTVGCGIRNVRGSARLWRKDRAPPVPQSASLHS
jgi:hypothetical protein